MKVLVKTKRRKRKLTAFGERMIDFLIDILSSVISGLITAAIIELFSC